MPTDQVEVYCTECAKPFWMDRSLVEDITRDHEQEGKQPVFICDECVADWQRE